MTLSERIASEIMDTIERERRINKDDLIAATERVLQRWDKEQHPLITIEVAPLPAGWSDYEQRVVEACPSYFRPKPPTRFGTWK